jgi:hypothetical protein
MTGTITTPSAGSSTFNQFIVDPATGYAVNVAPGSTLTQTALLVSSDGAKATYEYGVARFAQVATPTAFVVIKGSATKTVRIKKIRVAGVATAQGNMQIQFQRWSDAGTIGSAALTALTAVKHDTGSAAATCSVSTVGTANWTTAGTGSTIPFLCDTIFFGVVATGVVTPNEFNFATRQDQALILRGTSDWIILSGNGSAIPSGGVIDISIELEEDNS